MSIKVSWSLNYCCCSVTQSSPTLFDPMDYSTPVFHVLHCLPEFVQTHVHWVYDAPNHLFLCHPLLLLLSIFPSIKVFFNESALPSGGQSIGVSASTQVLPMNTQDWSPLGWTGWISLQSKGLSRVFFSNTIWKHQSFSAQSSSHIHTWLLEKS